jgi:hypothetical protein
MSPRTLAEITEAAQERISRPNAEREAIRALIQFRRVELHGASPEPADPKWYGAIEDLRDAADRLDEVNAYQATEAVAERIVLDDGRPCGHRDADACEACEPDPDIVEALRIDLEACGPNVKPAHLARTLAAAGWKR